MPEDTTGLDWFQVIDAAARDWTTILTGRPDPSRSGTVTVQTTPAGMTASVNQSGLLLFGGALLLGILLLKK